MKKSLYGVLAGIISTGFITGCTTQEKYAEYKKEFSQGQLQAGKLLLLTADQPMSGQIYYARLTIDNAVWTSELSNQPFRRTSEYQELFVISAEKMQIKPHFVSARGDEVVVPDKYQNVVCPPNFMSATLRRTKYDVCTTFFAGSFGSVKWNEMAAVLAASDLHTKISDRETVRMNALAVAEVQRKNAAVNREAKAKVTAAQAKEKDEVTRRERAVREDVRMEARYRARAIQCGPAQFAASYISHNKKFMAYRYNFDTDVQAYYRSANEMEQQMDREVKSMAPFDISSCLEDVRSMTALQKTREEQMLVSKQLREKFIGK